MQVEVDLANQDRALLPGMYANMKMTAHVTVSSLTAPDDALVFRNDKIYLPVVRENHLKLVEVTLGHDDGYTVEVNGDLRAGEQIAVNVGEAARDGEPVQPVREQCEQIVKGEKNGVQQNWQYGRRDIANRSWDLGDRRLDVGWNR